ncbi:hypothetical protein San01_07760 [Streptomyces angustmyceticus]|uniref:Uncharacterized protein n=1 Tax=Streptomyces angustmyceticus TaxID=285578 RepID=A0A5J4L9U6_9ACTN|nr:hypothetical protein San01_07760 [Streptomyces angustmyceticus]
MEILRGATTDQAPADPAATDDMPAGQPIGYWSGRAHAVVTRQLRDALAEIDVTQPQYWVLNSVKYCPEGPSRDEVAARLLSLADGPHDIPRTVAQLPPRLAAGRRRTASPPHRRGRSGQDAAARAGDRTPCRGPRRHQRRGVRGRAEGAAQDDLQRRGCREPVGR